MIRSAVAADAAAVAHVHRASRAEAYTHFGGPQRVITVSHWQDNLRGEVPTWVEDDGGAVVGFASADGAVLAGLYVLPGAQGSGVGTRLLARAVAAGARELWVYADHPRARAFYERHGWVAEPDTLYTGDDWLPREPALRYRLP